LAGWRILDRPFTWVAASTLDFAFAQGSPERFGRQIYFSWRDPYTIRGEACYIDTAKFLSEKHREITEIHREENRTTDGRTCGEHRRTGISRIRRNSSVQSVIIRGWSSLRTDERSSSWR
jgi:hypothetical protein